MNDAYFLDADGSPLGGKVPLQVRFSGGGDYARIRGLATAALHTFLRGVRTSIAPTHQRTFEFHNGGRVKLFHSYGITQVEVHLEPEFGGVDIFRQGIWLRPKYLLNESPFLTGISTLNEQNIALESLLPYEEIKSSGKTPTKPGRPALPGTPGGAETSWLVVDVAEDRPLGSTPIKDGTVKIWRAMAKNAGRFVECRDTPREYLLSCDLTTGVFYFGNRLAEKIPAAPILQLGGNSIAVMRYMKLRSYDLRYQGFASLGAVQGFVFFVVLTGAFPTRTFSLYGTNTRDAPATWQLLASEVLTSLDNVNVFGNTFAESVAPNGVVTIVCSGSNGAGVTSGFTVYITPQPGQQPALSGNLTLMGNGYVPAVPAVSTVYKTVSTPPTSITETKTFLSGVQYANPPPDYTTLKPLYGDWWTHVIPGETSVTQGGTYISGTQAQRPDMFLGGYFPTYPPASASWAFTSYTRTTPGAGWIDQYGYDTLAVYVGPGDYTQQRIHYDALYESAFTSTYTWANGYTGQTISHNYSYSSDYRGKWLDVWGSSAIPDISETITPTSYEVGFEFAPDQITRQQYWAFDTITASMAVRLEHYVTGRCLPGTLSTNIYHDDMKSLWSIPVWESISSNIFDWVTLQKDPDVATLRVIDTANDEKIKIPDVFTLLPTPRPLWATARTGYAGFVIGASFGGHRSMMPPMTKSLGSEYRNSTDPLETIGYSHVYPAFYRGRYPTMATYADAVAGWPANDYEQVSYSYSGAPFAFRGTPAEFGTAFPKSVYGRKSPGDIIYEMFVGETTLAYPKTVEAIIGMPGPSQAAGVVFPDGRIEPLFCGMYVDPRTKGYIVNAIIRVVDNPFADPSRWTHAVVSYIGNKFGAIPLQPVLDEWRALGETSPLTDGKTAMIYERRGTSPFIYNDTETYLL